MKLLFYAALLFLTVYTVYLSSSSVRQGELNFFNDVARDFLLLEELNDKKIVLIGPRSSTNGLFHGPLWTYINYPAFLLGNGNPVVVAWFWILLECIFLLTSFFMVRKLFGTFTALAFIALVSTRIVLHVNGIFHSEANFYFIPAFFFTICMYVKTKKNIYLASHILIASMLIQLNVGIGIQFFILSAIIISWFIIKHKLAKHILTFSLLPFFLLNFIVFDIRNDFRMVKAIVSTGESSKFFVPIGSWLANRFNNTISLQLLEQNNGNNLFSFIIFGLILGFAILQIKDKSQYRYAYLLFLYYYFGYILFSFFNKGILLFHYVYLLIPLTTLWFVSFLGGKYRFLFLPFVGIVLILNFNHVRANANFQVGNHPNSWKGLSSVASEVIVEEGEKEFGYFVFAPDAFAYQPRYAMLYHFKTSRVNAFEYVKKPTTYIIAAPPPPEDIYMTHVWWRKNSVKISSEPIETKKFPNGFTIEKFNLTQEEQAIAHDKTIELGIHFR